MAKRKRCKLKSCNKLFTPQYTTLQATCCIEHAIEYANEQKAKNKAALNIVRNEKISLDGLEKSIESTRILVNSYIRLRDHGKVCISCPTILTSGYDAGHIFSSKNHNSIRFDYRVIFGQCVQCNRYNEGNYDFARQKARLRLGDDEWAKVERKAAISRRVPHTWTRHELKLIRQDASFRIKELNQKKHK